MSRKIGEHIDPIEFHGCPQPSRHPRCLTVAHLEVDPPAFDEMIASLVAAREAIDDPALNPPPATSRNLAEGYRYLMGYVCGATERAFAEDTDFPYFKRAVPPHNKSTWDNADNLYLSAPIDPEQHYRIRGRARDTRHWRGEAAVAQPRDEVAK